MWQCPCSLCVKMLFRWLPNEYLFRWLRCHWTYWQPLVLIKVFVLLDVHGFFKPSPVPLQFLVDYHAVVSVYSVVLLNSVLCYSTDQGFSIDLMKIQLLGSNSCPMFLRNIVVRKSNNSSIGHHVCWATWDFILIMISLIVTYSSYTLMEELYLQDKAKL